MIYRIFRLFPSVITFVFALVISFYALANSNPGRFIEKPFLPGDDSFDKDTIKLKYPITDNSNDPVKRGKTSSIDLNTSTIYKNNLDFDSTLSDYILYNTIGKLRIGDEKRISLIDYLKEDNLYFQHNYFKERAKAQNFLQGRSSDVFQEINIKAPKAIEDIIGGGIDIKPQGSAELVFSYDYKKIANPSWSLKQQRQGQFKFDQNIKLSVRGNIGDKIGLGIGYDTESSFDFDNEIKLRYEGKEDDIVKLLEAGNVSLPVQGSLITGSQSLFGVKAKLQFGRLTVTSVFSQQKSEKKEITLENGAQKTTYSISALEYDANRHFFLNHYFRSQYENALSRIPVITSSIQITRIEVWVINRTGDFTNTRNVVAFADLGELEPWNSDPDNPKAGNYIQKNTKYIHPDNEANTLYESLTSNAAFRENSTASSELAKLNQAPYNLFNGQDYYKIDNARKLTDQEYTFDPQLGFISLNQRLDPGYALAVAYEYTINGVKRQVGEFAQDVPPDQDKPNVLFLKLLRSTAPYVDIPMWDLMMKNIYSLGSSQIQSTDFKLDVIYEDDKTGANLNYIPEGSEPTLQQTFLLELLGLDRLNNQNELGSDGVFDFLDGRTILTGPGKIMLPYLEPFGSHLKGQFKNKDVANKYVFQAIYDSTQVQAEQLKQYDKFYIRGEYMGASGSEISLNAINIPEGSVKVTAGGMQLRENVDYTVDYTLGRVKIINQSILNGGQPIKISAESNTLFSIQQKSLMGSRFDYKFNDDFNLGSTFLYLKEKPLTQKVNIGDEPINNVILGFDGTYTTESPFLTKMVDKLPLIETKEKSEILVTGEFAQLIPGHPKIIGPTGTSYLDDFEGSEVPYDLRTGNYWVLSSTPQGQPGIWKNGSATNDLSYNYNRARISWYIIDDMFYRSNSYTPANIDNDMLSLHSMREVLETEVFRNKQLVPGVPATLRTFDIAYFPNERGPFNFDADHIDENGNLTNPGNNWGGIMRRIETNDFEAANIEYIEFWMMDPYADYPDNPPDGGTMYLHIGEISEDILKDGNKTFENGFPKDSMTTPYNSIKTIWGYVPTITPINYAFDNDPTSRKFQDIGLDGLSDVQERSFYKEFLDSLRKKLLPAALARYESDPSGDDYQFFRGDSLDDADADIIERYKYYRNTEGNTPISDPGDKFSTTGSLSPDVEDINMDFTLNDNEAYYQYGIKIKNKNDPSMQVGQNYIVDKIKVQKDLKNGKTDEVVWYQFKIPVRSYTKRIGAIRDFRSIRFMRLVMTDFEDPVVCRFARLQLVRGDWRKYLYDLNSPGEFTGTDPIDSSSFDISTVNIEANGVRTPIPYVLPPGIEREVDYSYTELIEQNEQSLSFTTCLEDGEAKAAYKNTSVDVRTYKRLKMFVHAEGKAGQQLDDGDLSLFIRLGTDFEQNYYEYEIPLYPTDPQIGNDPEEIWREENQIDIAFDEFFRVKQIRETTTGVSLNEPFTRYDTNRKGKITIVGIPDLSNVKVIMIGVRNPPKDDPWNPNDNGMAKCGIVWVNELRVTDFDERGGWAAIGRATVNLADFGRITASGNVETVGFGGIEQKLQDRAKEETRGYDVQSFLQLGKFFPQKAGVKIPMYYNISETRVIPQYNPLNPDILMKTTLDIAPPEDRDSIRNVTETVVSRRSLNFMNVQKTRGSGQKMHFYDVENFLMSYVYSDVFKRDVNTEKDLKKSHQLILNYNYSFPDKSISPFSKLSRSKYLKLITDFNINLFPQSLSFKTQIDRRYGEIQYRNTGNVMKIIRPLYDKNFTMKRVYNYRHNFARSLRFTYDATVDAYIQEPDGPLTKGSRDEILTSFKEFGKTRTFNQKVNFAYNLPLRKIPMLDWVTARANYTGSYNWQEAPPTNDTLGNSISNSQTIQLTGQLNFVTLYSKIDFLKNINRGKSNVDIIRKKKEKEQKKNEVTNPDEKVDENEEEPTDENTVDVNEGFIKTAESILRVLMSLRSININYTNNNGTTMPGFNMLPQYVGNDWNNNAPGLPFILGVQDTNFKWRSAAGGWLSKDPTLSSFYMTSHTENLSIQGNIEPVKGFKINVSMTRNMVMNSQGLFKYDENIEDYKLYSPVENGSFSMSYWSMNTALKGKWDEDVSAVYQSFINNRYFIAKKLSQDKFGISLTDTTTEFPVGYSRNSQDVLIPAFLAAVSGAKDASQYPVNPFRAIPAPNWRLTYNGLSKLDFVKEYARNVSISHSYRSTYTVSSFSSNLDYLENPSWVLGEDVEPQYNIQQITISEQLTPLLGIDINWVNSWTSRVEYRTTRTMSFSFSNYQMTEIRTRDFTVGIGYRAKEVKLPFKVRGKIAILENDLNFKFDMTIKNNRSNIMRMDGDNNEPVGGNKMITVKPMVDYIVNDNLTFRLFFNYNKTLPAISTSYPTSLTNGGFSVTYTLGQ